jgi:hypothetical protein
MRIIFFILTIAFFLTGSIDAQLPVLVRRPNIASVKLHRPGDPLSFPVIRLNSNEELDLYFDDLDGSYKNYYYSYQLCNADWTPAGLHIFDFVRGFQNVRITTYRNSTIAFTRYTHYQARIPDKNCVPTRSGNYLLKVFLDGDTSKLVFTKRFMVVDNKTSVGAQVLQPFNGSIFRTHQKLQVAVNIKPQLNVFSQQDIKVVLLQNQNWASATVLTRPGIFRGNYLEYNDEAYTAFPAGKEWRWIDLRSVRLMSERMVRIDKQPTRTDVYVKPDGERQQQAYLFYQDINGLYTIETTDNVNPFWQSDYAYVHFSYFPPANRPYAEKDIFLFGEFTGYALDENARMDFDESKGAYIKTMLLKQGFYNYSYVTLPVKKGNEKVSFENTEGNYWGTENSYQVLVYYRSFGSRADELIGFESLNSFFHRPGG